MENTALDTAVIAIVVIAVRQGLEMAAKAIPDSETGMLGALRKAFKILALYIPNKP